MLREFSQISYHERQQIYTGSCQQRSMRQMAKILDRSPSSISREIAKHSDKYGYFYAGIAQELTEKRKNVNKSKIDRNHHLKGYIIEKLNKKWSPKMIAGRWSLETPKQKISAESIYSWLYNSNEQEKIELRKCLIRKHKTRGLRPKKSKANIKGRVSIHDRPEVINERSEAGHYEGDLMFNKGSQSQNICTLIERVTRKTFLIRNDNKTTKTVIDALLDLIDEKKLVMKSITFDNGSEFADHARLKERGIDTYFCDPGSPWQKGAIEHDNGMLRRFVPFNLSAECITKEYVEMVNEMINDMPREILQFRTPDDVFDMTFNHKKLKTSRVKRCLAGDGGNKNNVFNQNIQSVAFHS
jgi:IS30 family transposase